MHLLCMIKARIRWCTCRVENILTLDKLLSLWFCFLLHSILFMISQTSYRTYKIISSYELARPVMGTICDRTWEKGPIDVVDHFVFFNTFGTCASLPHYGYLSER